VVTVVCVVPLVFLLVVVVCVTPELPLVFLLLLMCEGLRASTSRLSTVRKGDAGTDGEGEGDNPEPADRRLDFAAGVGDEGGAFLVPCRTLGPSLSSSSSRGADPVEDDTSLTGLRAGRGVKSDVACRRRSNSKSSSKSSGVSCRG
jgi:hypothetical protein